MTNDELREQAIEIYRYENPEEVRKDLQGARVAYAVYETGDYDGGWCVIYVKHGQWYVDEGSHCSCNGPEWHPEKTTPEHLLSSNFGPYLVDQERVHAAVKAVMEEIAVSDAIDDVRQ